jgi:hypothetical protein
VGSEATGASNQESKRKSCYGQKLVPMMGHWEVCVMPDRFYKVDVKTAETLRKLGLEYVPNNTIHQKWVDLIKDSKLIAECRVEGDAVFYIQFVNNVERYVPVTFKETISFNDGMCLESERLLRVCYVPLFDEFSFEIWRTDWNEAIHISHPSLTGENLEKYLKLMSQVHSYRAMFMASFTN